MELTVQAVQNMGFQLGVFHVECKYTSRGARLIEVNCRMGGGLNHAANQLVWGVDLVEQHLRAFVGASINPTIAKKPIKEVAHVSHYQL